MLEIIDTNADANAMFMLISYAHTPFAHADMQTCSYGDVASMLRSAMLRIPFQHKKPAPLKSIAMHTKYTKITTAVDIQKEDVVCLSLDLGLIQPDQHPGVVAQRVADMVPGVFAVGVVGEVEGPEEGTED